MAKSVPHADVLCHDWEALKRAAAETEIAYEFDGHQVHVWTRTPKLGDPCTCGARTWA